MTNFANPQGLQQLGDNAWAETSESGPAAARPGRQRRIRRWCRRGALEASNVDLTEQLVNMITAQRNFQANAQMISDAGPDHADDHQHPLMARCDGATPWTASLYIAMTGARETLRAQAVNNHNLANADTVGFQRDARRHSRSRAVCRRGTRIARRTPTDRTLGVEQRPAARCSTPAAISMSRCRPRQLASRCRPATAATPTRAPAT